jgi:hypothetical protein
VDALELPRDAGAGRGLDIGGRRGGHSGRHWPERLSLVLPHAREPRQVGEDDLLFRRCNPALADQPRQLCSVRTYQYVAGKPRKIGFNLVFFKGPVKQSVDWLRSLLYPECAGTMLKNALDRVLFTFGDLHSGVLGVVRRVKAWFFRVFEETVCCLSTGLLP